MILAASGDWFVDTWDGLWQVPVSAVAMLFIIIAAVRIAGLRSFSKMSSFDFAITISIGSILGGAATSSAPLVNAALAAISLLVVQAMVSLVRSRDRRVVAAVDNTPMLLMDGGEMLDENLRSARVSAGDVIAKLRAANVLRLEDVRAVVLETTGDISVLHGAHRVDAALLDGVRRGPSTDRVDALDRGAGS